MNELNKENAVLPMGTIMTGCMITGLLFATRLPLLRELQQLSTWIRKIAGVVVLAAGSWNVLWYAARHLTEFWGIAALVSGVLMLLTSAYILDYSRLPVVLKRIRPAVLLLLLGCALLYGITIYRI